MISSARTDGKTFSIYKEIETHKFVSLGSQKGDKTILHTVFLKRAPLTGFLSTTNPNKLSGNLTQYILYDNSILLGCLFTSNKEKTKISPFKMRIGNCKEQVTKVEAKFIAENLGIMIYQSTSSLLLTALEIKSDLIISSDIYGLETMVKRDLTDLKRTLRKDPRYKRLSDSFENIPHYSMPIDDHIKSIHTLHKIRPVRILNSDDPDFPDKLLNASIADQSSRSRLTEILMVGKRVEMGLEKAVKKMKDHLITTYSEDLKVVKTQKEREMFLNSVLRRFIDYVDQVKIMSDLARLAIEDIDKASYAMRLAADIIRIDRRKESVL